MSLLEKLKRDMRPRYSFPPLDPNPVKAEKLNRARWEHGLLGSLLYPFQRPLYQAFTEHLSKEDVLLYVALCARRYGKTSVALCVQMERCIRHKNYMAVYVTKTGAQARKIVIPALKRLLETCPHDLRPRFDRQDNVFTFPNGSMLHMIGLDNDREDEVRGIASDLTIADEPAFWDRCEDQLTNAVYPPLLTTNGKCLAVTTPSTEPGHYAEDMVRLALEDNTLFYADYRAYESFYGEKRMAQFKRLAGGEHSEKFRREYLCEFVRDPSRVVFPNFVPEHCTPGALNVSWPSLELCDRFSGMDHGVTHASAYVAGRYERSTGLFFVDGEMEWRKADITTAMMASDVFLLERRLWGNAPGRVLRLVDNASKQLIVDFAAQYNLPCTGCDKSDGLHAMLERTGTWLAEGRIVLDPAKCPRLIADLNTTKWDKSRRKLAESAQGHSDLTMALVYTVNRLAKYPRFQEEAPPAPDTSWYGTRKKAGGRWGALDALWSKP